MKKEFNTIIAKGKYSNVNIFERRLKERGKFYTNNHSLNINLNKSNLFNNTSISSTSPSTKRTTIFTSTKRRKTRPKIDLKVTLNNKDYYIDSNDSNLNFYLTEIPLINTSNNKNNKDIKLIRIFEKEKNNSNLFHLKKNQILKIN